MKTAIAIRHIHFEDIGTLDTVFSDYGYKVEYIDLMLGELVSPNIQQADLLIILGGPIGAYDEKAYPFLEDEMAIIHQWLQARKPMLGICLGAQLIARVLGAKVSPLGVKEIGFSPLTLTTSGRDSPLSILEDVPVLHWHGDQFDIPDGCVLLASTPVCANQAFSFGTNVLALQFHLEFDERRVEQWLVGHASELGQTNLDPRKLRADAASFGKHLAIVASSVLANWLRQLEK